MKHTDKIEKTASAPETRIDTTELAYREANPQWQYYDVYSPGIRREWMKANKRTIPAEKPTGSPLTAGIDWKAAAQVAASKYDEAQAQAAQLAEALRDLLDVVERIGPPQITQGGLCEEQDWATATSKAGHRLQQWKANQ